MTIDRFRLIETFVSVASLGSFSSAAEELGMSRAAVSKHITDLETFLGSRLLNRSTRKVSLTEIGNVYCESCLKLLADLEAATHAAKSLQSKPQGTLRLLAPRAFASGHLADAIAQFAITYPTIQIALTVYDSGSKALNPNDGAFDVAIRLWPLESDSPFIAKKIGSLEWIVCASPAYLDEHGIPKTPDDLSAHNCLINPRLSPDRIWRFPESARSVKVSGSFQANSIPIIRKAALAGIGVAMLPRYFVGGDLQAGKLQIVLPDFRPPERPVWLLFPCERPTNKVRLFQNFMVEWTKNRSWDSLSFDDAC